MSWLRPDWLWLLIPAAALLLLSELFVRRLRARDLKRFAGSRTLAARPPSGGRYRLLCWAALSIVLALAGPQWGRRLVESPLHGIDLMAVLDTSRSMNVRDVEPDRIGRARRELLDLAERFSAGRLGLIAFGGSGDLVCPLTHDRAGFMSFVREVDPLLTAQGGTSIGAGLERALSALDSKSPVKQVILLLSDGENLQQDERVTAASWTAYSRGVVIHSMVVGADSGGRVPAGSLDGSGFVRDEQDREVVSRPNGELLKAIAERTGGLYLEAAGEPFPLARLVRERLTDLELSAGGKAWRAEPADRSVWFLSLALLLLLSPFLIESQRALFRTARVSALPLLMIAPLIAGGSGAADSARQGVASFERGDFLAAQRSFEEAFQQDPQSAEIGFDLAVCACALGQFEQAARGFERSRLLAGPQLSAKAAFGAGLARARQARRVVEQAGEQPSGLGAAIALLRRSRIEFVEALRLGYGRPAAVDLELVTQSLRDLEQKLASANQSGTDQKRDGSSDQQAPPASDQSEGQAGPDSEDPESNQDNPSAADQEQDRQDASREASLNAPSEEPSRLPGGMFREEAGNLEEIVRRYDRERRQYDQERARQGRARTERDW